MSEPLQLVRFDAEKQRLRMTKLLTPTLRLSLATILISVNSTLSSPRLIEAKPSLLRMGDGHRLSALVEKLFKKCGIKVTILNKPNSDYQTTALELFFVNMIRRQLREHILFFCSNYQNQLSKKCLLINIVLKLLT